MLDQRSPYWFHAKRYGWGWRMPARREGWIVLIAWVVIIMAATPLIALQSVLLCYIFIGVMCAILVAVCFAKGEPPRWQWGNRD